MIGHPQASQQMDQVLSEQSGWSIYCLLGILWATWCFWTTANIRWGEGIFEEAVQGRVWLHVWWPSQSRLFNGSKINWEWDKSTSLQQNWRFYTCNSKSGWQWNDWRGKGCNVTRVYTMAIKAMMVRSNKLCCFKILGTLKTML